MKRLFISFVFVILFMVEVIIPQTYNVTVRDQHTVGSDFVFDIYIRMNEPAEFYLGGSDFSLYFNSNFFSEPIASVQNSQALQSYTSAISILNSNVIVLNILPPFFSNQHEFESIAAKINSIEPGTKIASITLSGIINFSGEAGLLWKEQTPNQCVIYSFENSSPWFTTEKTSDGEFISPSSSPLPVELSSFTSVVIGNSVELNWTTETEVNNYGFDVERTSPTPEAGKPFPPPYKGGGGEAGGGWQRIGFVNGNGNSNSQKQYSYTDINLNSGKYSYRLKQIDNDGSFSLSDIINLDVVEIPNTFALEQNYPNPFNPSTTIQFNVGDAYYASPAWVTLRIYDVLGKEVKTLVDEYKEPGKYEVEFTGSSLASGMYIYKLTATPTDGHAGNFTSIKKMLLIK